MSSLNRSLARLALCAVPLLVCAAPAPASHIKGGSVTAAIGADQHLTGHVEFIYRAAGACPAAPSQIVGASVQVTGPAGFSANPSLTNAVMSACLPSTKTESGDFDLDLSAAPDGAYTITYGNCCRVTPIANVSGGSAGSTAYSARIIKAGATVTATPAMNSNVSLGISTHAAYDQNLNATGSLPLGYLLLQSLASGQPDYDTTGPSSNIVVLTGTGNVSIPAGTTSGLVAGTAYVYKVRVVDVFGNSSEREVLLTVSNNNVPVIAGLQTTVDVPAGETTTLQFNATDVDGSQVVSILPAGLPAWATVTPTSGNPATATMTITPPAILAPQDVVVNIDATDNDNTAPMTDSRSMTLRVTAPVPVTPPVPVVPPVVPPAPVLAPPPPATLPPPAPPAPPAPVRKPAAKPASAELVAHEALVAAGGETSVGCSVTGSALKACTVKAYVKITGADGKTQLVLVGSGDAGAVRPGGSGRATLRLNVRGRGLAARVGGVKIVLKLTGRTVAGTTVRARGTALLLPRRASMVTSTGLFASGSAELTDAARASVDRLARSLARVQSIVCTGNTDGRGDHAYNARLALARAKTVCAVLRAGRPGVAITIRGAGESRPAASNDTHDGRARNRRVEVLLTY